MGLTLTANIVITDLVKKANVILIIPDVVLQTCVYSISTIHAVFYNKARKVFKLNNLARFT